MYVRGTVALIEPVKLQLFAGSNPALRHKRMPGGFGKKIVPDKDVYVKCITIEKNSDQAFSKSIRGFPFMQVASAKKPCLMADTVYSESGPKAIFPLGAGYTQANSRSFARTLVKTKQPNENR